MSGEVTGPRILSLPVVLLKGLGAYPVLNIYVYSHTILLLLQPWSEKLLYSGEIRNWSRTEQKQLLRVSMILSTAQGPCGRQCGRRKSAGSAV